MRPWTVTMPKRSRSEEANAGHKMPFGGGGSDSTNMGLLAVSPKGGCENRGLV